MDPANEVEDQYKRKHDQVFSWRCLRAISFVEMSNFHGQPNTKPGFVRFEGNVEEQTRLLQQKSAKKNIDDFFTVGTKVKEEEENVQVVVKTEDEGEHKQENGK